MSSHTPLMSTTKYAPLLDSQDDPNSDSVAISFDKGHSFGCFVSGARPDPFLTGEVLRPLPTGAEVVAALVPAYNEEASDALTTLTDLWYQEQHLKDGKKILVNVVLDGLDRGPGGKKIMSDSMRSWLGLCFPGCEEQWRSFESNTDMSNNLFLQRVGPTGELCPVEFAEGMSLYLTVLVKRGNRLKFNSHEWFLKGLALQYRKQVQYVFLTDAGTGFDRNCLSHLVEHLARSSPDVVAVTGRQRVKTAAMQSHGQVCSEAFLSRAWWLRSLQAYEYEAGVSTFNGVFSLLGYMPVLPGPCALLKFKTCLEDGGIDEYLDLVNSPPEDDASDVELWQRGNENLAEDRILSFTIVFPARIKAVRRTEWVPLALFYYDAETEFRTLCPQRRRWINGTYAAYLTVADRLNDLVGRGAAPASEIDVTARPRASSLDTTISGMTGGGVTISTGSSGSQFDAAVGLCWKRQKQRWAGGCAVLRLRALLVLVRLQIAMHYITCLSPSLFGLAVRLSLLTLISNSTAPGTLWEEDRESRARFVCLFSDVAIWLGLRAWINVHSKSAPGRVDTRIMVFFSLIVTCCYSILLTGLGSYTAQVEVGDCFEGDEDCDSLPEWMMLFPLVIAVIQFAFPLLLATGYGFLAAVGNAYSFRSLLANLALSFGHVFVSAAPYLASLPCYVSLMHLYSTARLHDLSWGTRDTSQGEDLAARQSKISQVSADFSRDVLLYNGFVLAAGFSLDLLFGPKSTALILAGVALVVVVPSMAHVAGSLVHLIMHMVTPHRHKMFWRIMLVLAGIGGIIAIGYLNPNHD